MKVVLEQLFFGRGPYGYAVLGSSPGGEPFRADVASLCESVGTRSGSAFQPFLESRPCRNSVLMAKVSRGEPDSEGRETMFFHVLVGSARELAAARVDASVLDGLGLFRDKLPQHVERLEVSTDALPADLPPPRFDTRERRQVPAAGPASVGAGNRERPSGKRERGAWMLKVSLAVNLILLVLCVIFFALKPPSEGSLGTEERSRLLAEIKRLEGASGAKGISRADVIRELRNEFEVQYHGIKIDEAMLGDIGAEYQESFRPYVRFVNKVVLETSDIK